jgi:hypothetical protein
LGGLIDRGMQDQQRCIVRGETMARSGWDRARAGGGGLAAAAAAAQFG